VFFNIEKWLIRISYGFNIAAGVCILTMMLLTCTDVFLRLFRHPITGTYEIVGFLGALFVSFSLAYTSYQRGHIAVDFLIQKFSENIRGVVMCINDLLGSVLFLLIARQCVFYANSLKSSGTVSMTLQMPVYPVAYGLAMGCGLLGLLLFFISLSNILNILKTHKTA